MAYVSANIPHEVSDILEDLGVIAKLPSSNKLNVHSGTYTPSQSWGGSAKRTVSSWIGYNESKEGTINYVNDKIDEALQTAKKYPLWVERIADAVSLTANALTNLKHTYGTYPRIMTRIETTKLRISREAFLEACRSETVPVEIPLVNKSNLPKVGSPPTPPKIEEVDKSTKN